MLYVGLDCHKRYAQLNAIDEKESHPCFGGPRPHVQDIPQENRRDTSWNPKGKETRNSKKASMNPTQPGHGLAPRILVSPAEPEWPLR